MSHEPSEFGPGLLGDLADEDSVRKLIECPICLEIPLPPIYLCTKGHIVCSSCQARTYVCPLCRERYCNTRSFVAEGIVDKCTLRCRYTESGCDVSMKGADLGDHLAVCEFRPVNCRECADKMVNYSEYETHLFKDHNLSGTVGNEAYVAYRINLNFMQRTLGLVVDTCFWPQYYIKAFDQVFLLRLNAHQFSINPWVCLFGAPNECSNYSALIEYEPNNDGIVVHSWKGPVNHFRDEPIDVIAQGKALSIPVDTIMESGAISTERAEWIYHVVLYENEKNPCTPLPGEIKELPSLEQLFTASPVMPLEGDGDSVMRSQSDGIPTPAPRYTMPASGDANSATPTSLTPDSMPNMSSPSLLSNANSSNVSIGVRPVLRKPKATNPPVNRKKNDRTTDSAGNQGDIDDISDFDWE